MDTQELSEASKTVIKALEVFQLELMKTASENPEFLMSSEYRRSLANKFFIEHSGVAEKINRVDDFYIDNIIDDYKIPVRLYDSTVSDEDRILLFIHGGGWLQGNLETHDYLCRKISKLFGINVLAVDYRLAPEYVFPVQLDDVYSAYSWCFENYKEVVLSGDSAGGNLCAALCIKLHDEQAKKKPFAQILFYPALSNDFNSESFEKFKDIPSLTKTGALLFASQYAGKSCLDEDVLNNKLFYPILEDDTRAFPSTYIITAGHDVLLDGQLKFVEKLRNGGAQVNHTIIEGAVHGFMTYGKEYEQEITSVLEKQATFF